MNVSIPYCPRYPQTEIHPQIESHRFCVLVTHRQMGKTVCAINHMIKMALINPKPAPRYFYVAPFLKQAKLIAWDYLRKYTRNLPNVKVNEVETSVTLPNGAKIWVAGADNEDALRGTYADGVVLDEYGDIKPHVFNEIIRPMLLSRAGWTLFFGTPKGQNQFFEVYQLALHEQAKNPQGDWWAGIYRAEETGVISPEELDKIRRETPENTFRQEYLCDFAASAADCVFPSEILQQAEKNSLPGGGERVAALDVARYGDDLTVLFVWENSGAFKWKELCTENWNGKDTMYTVGRVADAAKRLHFTRLVVDGDGLGGGVVDRLRELAAGFRVLEFRGGTKADDKRFINKRAESFFALRDYMEKGYLQINSRPALAELAAVTYSFNSLGQIRMFSKEDLRAKGEKSPNYADAAMMSATLFKTSGQAVLRGARARVLTADSNLYF